MQSYVLCLFVHVPPPLAEADFSGQPAVSQGLQNNTDMLAETTDKRNV